MRKICIKTEFWVYFYDFEFNTLDFDIFWLEKENDR